MKGTDSECACQRGARPGTVKKTSFRGNADAGFSSIKDEIQDCTSEDRLHSDEAQ